MQAPSQSLTLFDATENRWRTFTSNEEGWLSIPPGRYLLDEPRSEPKGDSVSTPTMSA